jgi:Flp pilus assembly pilin Flp
MVAPSRGQTEFALKSLLVSFLKDETAVTTIDYGLIAAGISVAIVGS